MHTKTINSLAKITKIINQGLRQRLNKKNAIENANKNKAYAEIMQ